jgi:rRNA N6-adenosine-methyltransferase METTL5
MKVKQLEWQLQNVKTFQNPKVYLEQYITTPHLASNILHIIDETFDDIQSKSICDLGVGTGNIDLHTLIYF